MFERDKNHKRASRAANPQKRSSTTRMRDPECPKGPPEAYRYAVCDLSSYLQITREGEFSRARCVISNVVWIGGRSCGCNKGVTTRMIVPVRTPLFPAQTLFF
ncbi:hypothetical protein MPTK1_2g06840 [Marchantia polymorpha subsp. ruderalis]|uniref:Uncharacterized protein n=1 Tax=Marchantia polymorpha TaxID=3197 RepID=A0A2R6XDW8_MARPO|nr:hypothetical protein MARPO_0021s0137 [Marchantia polymorpha]BBN01357.1 hypothetical protein Mp_2g06840 [Marchantia polymorpha subsp. ruderalis]|eukprot:PTQ44283.1 hypothetical protein MARPO_0021s0137 [Marchantia polymorpha]